MVLPKTLQGIAADLEARRAELLALIAAMSERQAGWEPAPGQWSVGRAVEHLTLAEGLTGDLTAALTGRDGLPGWPADFVLDPLPPPTGLEAPDRIRPGEGFAPSAIAARMQELKVRARVSFTRVAGVDPRECVVPHPLFGPLNVAQWWAVQPVHYAMHLAQVRAVIAMPGYPGR